MSSGKTRIKRRLAAAAACICLAAPAAAGGVQKLGFINVERVYRESQQAQSIQQKLDAEFAERQQKLEAAQRELAQWQKTNPASGKEWTARAAEYERRSRALRAEQQQLAEDYDLRRNEEFAALQRNADRVMIDLAKKEGYDLIVHDVIFIDAKFDITDKVIREMNR